ncbi:MAG: glycosyltransferase family 2 protein [Hyphomonadaceae bacterium]|nr:glycosyltransferase family 2 protein [Hyphomonadaceae bacterium]
MPTEQTIIVRDRPQTPRLSVLTPFYRYDPSAMLKRLANAPAGVEFVLFDDGSASAELIANVMSAAAMTGAPSRIIISETNLGRARARNRLIAEARGRHVLFLDADMLPDTSAFLSVWLGIIATQEPRVAFGGLSLAHAEPTPETALHYALFGRSDCAPARRRSRRSAQATASSNLLVERDFLLAHPFDDHFTGWGFEDIDWALDVSRVEEIMHVDNPATHAGLDDVSTLMRKSAEAGPNFGRLARKHPMRVKSFAAHRVASALRASPARKTQRRIYSWLARDPRGVAPMRVRCAALKLLRASHYAEYLP